MPVKEGEMKILSVDWYGFEEPVGNVHIEVVPRATLGGCQWVPLTDDAGLAEEILENADFPPYPIPIIVHGHR